MPSPRGHGTGEGGPGPRAQGAAQAQGAAEKLADAATDRRRVQGPEKVGALEDSWASGWSKISQRTTQATEARRGGLGAALGRMDAHPETGHDDRQEQVQGDYGAFARNSQVKRGERMGRGGQTFGCNMLGILPTGWPRLGTGVTGRTMGNSQDGHAGGRAEACPEGPLERGTRSWATCRAGLTISGQPQSVELCTDPGDSKATCPDGS